MREFLSSDVARRSRVLAAVFLVSVAYFYEGGGWNQNTRFDLVRAITERHTLQIDVYASNTGDRAQVDGHFYTDKAPGASLTAVPAVAVARALFSLARVDLYAPDTIAWLSHVATVAAAGIPAALAGIAIFLLAVRLGAPSNAAAVAAVVCTLGTPLWAYGTLLYGHALAAGCLAAAALGVVWVGDGARTARERLIGIGVGAAAGWAVVTEFPAAIPSAAVGLWALWAARRWPRQRLVPYVACLAAGAGAAAIVLLTYNWLAFHSLFYIAYTSEEGSFEAMKTGLFGINRPSLEAVRELLFGRFRGLLPLAPVLAVAPAGWWMWLRNRSTRPVTMLSIGIAVYYLLLTAGYSYWSGGWSYASRHLGPALPFVALGLAPLWARGGRIVRALVLALALVSVGQTLVAVATTPQPDGGSSGPRDPMRELLWPAFVSGDFPIGWQSVLERDAPREPLAELERRGVRRASWNLGQKIGLTGHASLVPLYVIWIAGTVAWVRIDRRSTAA